MPGYGDVTIKTNTKFLKIEAGDPHDIRLLNQEPTEIYKHNFPPPQKPVLCEGATCVHCGAGNEPGQKFITNVFDFNAGKVKLLEYGSMLAKQFQEISKTLGEEGRQINDVDLKITATGSNLAKRYQTTPRGTSKPLPKDLELFDIEAGDVPF
jgi:hypothetical protein